MAFNINEFKSVMDKYGGPAKNNLFVVTLNPPYGQDQRFRGRRKVDYIPFSDMRFFCREINLPAVNVNTFAHQSNSIGIAQNMPINLSTPSINATFMLDSEHRVISFFHSWMQEIINYDTIGGRLSTVNGDHMPFEIGYKDDYACVMEIDHYKTNAQGIADADGRLASNTEIYHYTLEGVYPTEVSGRSLSWIPDDNVATLGVNFTASKFSFSGSTAGTPNSDLSRGAGVLEVLKSVGYTGQTVQQKNLPTSIQDIINTYTTVRNDFGAIKNTFAALKNIF